MTREERKTELSIIRSHLITVMEDLIHYRNRLEEAHCKSISKRMDAVIGKLYDLVSIIK